MAVEVERHGNVRFDQRTATSNLMLPASRHTHATAVDCESALGAVRAERLAKILAVSNKQIVEKNPVPRWQFLA